MALKTLTNAIIALHATAHIEQGRELPTRLLICPWGVSNTNKGRIVCNSTTLSILPQNNALAKRDRVAIDFNHNTVEGSPAYKGEPAKVAAYANFEVIEGQGIYLSAIDWTPEGREHAAGGHYPDLSPAIALNDAGEIIFLHSAGLARQGEIDGVVLFSAPSITTLIKTFTTTQSNNDMDFKSLCLAILGLSADATDEQIKAAAHEFGKTSKSPEDVKALSARLDEFEKNLKTFNAASVETERKRITERASREGKVIPLSAEQIAGLDITTLSALVDGLPVTVPLEARTPEKIIELSAGTVTGGADETVRKQLGISKEAWEAVK